MMGQLTLRAADVISGPVSIFPRNQELNNSRKTAIEFREFTKCTLGSRVCLDANKDRVKLVGEPTDMVHNHSVTLDSVEKM